MAVFGLVFVRAAAKVFTVTPPSLLLASEGIKDVLRSYMAGPGHPPTLLTELDSFAYRA